MPQLGELTSGQIRTLFVSHYMEYTVMILAGASNAIPPVIWKAIEFASKWNK